MMEGFKKSMRMVGVLVVAIFLVMEGGHAATNNKIVMPWACLENCGDNITNDLLQLKSNSPGAGNGLFTAVSYPRYFVEANSTVTLVNVTDITADALSWGLKAYPMISCNDIHHLRQLFSNPQPVIDAITQAGVVGKLH